MRFFVRELEVYDAETFAFRGHIEVPRLGVSWGLAACAHNRCVYVSDSNNDRVHRIDPRASSNSMKNWRVAGNPQGLSVNREHNVVVVCRAASKIQEYTMRGALVREISLQACLASPCHAVQLSTGDYVVSQSQEVSPIAVSLVRTDGEVVVGRRQSPTSVAGKTMFPTSVAVAKDDNVLVADTDSNRILSMNSSLSRAEEMILPGEGWMQQPWVCISTSHVVDFTSAKTVDDCECWFSISLCNVNF